MRQIFEEARDVLVAQRANLAARLRDKPADLLELIEALATTQAAIGAVDQAMKELASDFAE